MYITLKDLLKEINSNSYSFIRIFGAIDLTLFYNNIKGFMNDDIFCLYSSNNSVKINKHQIMKIIKGHNLITIELDNYLKLNIS